MKSIKLGNDSVGDSCPCYIIAEIGGLFKNFEEAKRLIDTAIDIGVNAVKFQTLEAETIF
jgi:sialic acid synthase SpsE